MNNADARALAERRVWEEFRDRWQSVIRDITSLQESYDYGSDGYQACQDALGGLRWLLEPSERMVVIHKKSEYKRAIAAPLDTAIVDDGDGEADED